MPYGCRSQNVKGQGHNVVITGKWFLAHNCFPFTSAIIKLHAQIPCESRICLTDIGVKNLGSLNCLPRGVFVPLGQPHSSCCYLHMVAAGELCCLSDNSGYLVTLTLNFESHTLNVAILILLPFGRLRCLLTTLVYFLETYCNAVCGVVFGLSGRGSLSFKLGCLCHDFEDRFSLDF